MGGPDQDWLDALSAEEVDAVGAFVMATVRGDDATLPPELEARLGEERGPVFVGLRRKGALEQAVWMQAENQKLAIERALAQAREQLDAEAFDAIETIELLLTHRFKPVNLRNKDQRFQLMSNVFRGMRGIECGFSGQFHYLGPTVMLEHGMKWVEALEAMRERLNVSKETFESSRVSIRRFDSAQILVKLAKKETVQLFRGFRVIPVSEVDRAGVERLQEYLGNFLYNNVQEDGRLVYFYEPGLGKEADVPNNMIRQWMATIAMSRTAHYRGHDPALYEIVERNIRFNLRNFYRATGSLGLIEYGNMVKLGAVALAAIALVEHPTEFARPERKLYNLIEHLWTPSGKFECFFKPKGRDLAHNFYPGEAMLAWSYRLERKLDEKLLAKFMTSYRYYRKWHLENRNPAFIPWHTQAYYKVYRKTNDEELVDWIFEMNDWLIAEMQQWDEVMFPDAMGRFYNPNKGYGPPHASSTGVYMEGIIDAFVLARERGDEERRERYRVSLIRGLRSCMQLTFWDDTDMFYVKDPDRTRGGVRTTVYHPLIRVDNVQHNLMAILKVLENFEDDDFVHPA